MRSLCCSVLALLAVISVPAAAIPLFSQSPDLRTLRANDYGWFDDEGFITADNFALGSAGVIRSITWFGGYGVGTDLPGLIDDFVIAFYEDAGGLPAEDPFAVRHIGAAAARVDTGNTYDGFVTPFANYQYQVNIEDVLLLGSTQYYIAIINDTRGYEQDWLWGSSVQHAGHDDWICRRTLTPSCSQWTTAGAMDHAFTLNNHVFVPVPATLGLFALGLAGLGWTRRRKA